MYMHNVCNINTCVYVCEDCRYDSSARIEAENFYELRGPGDKIDLLDPTTGGDDDPSESGFGVHWTARLICRLPTHRMANIFRSGFLYQ
jgi:hypothetical protein